MVAAVSPAPSPVSPSVSALNGGADGANGISLDAAPPGGGNAFATLLQKHMGRHIPADSSNATGNASAANAAGAEETTEIQMVATDLAALLPFLEAAGLTGKGATTPDPEQPDAQLTDNALALEGDSSLAAGSGETLVPAAILGAPPPAAAAAAATGATLPAQTRGTGMPAIALAANQADASAASANIAAQQANTATADSTATLVLPSADQPEAAGATPSFASQLSAAQKALPGQAPAIQELSAVEGTQQQAPAPALQATQQAGLAASQLHANERAAAAPALPVPSPVGTPQWRQELGDQVVWMASRLENRAELVLNPPQMGRIEVSLTVSGDQANAVFTSANPVVRDALEASLPRLREVLADAGIQLGQAQVGAENAQQSAQQDKNGDNFGPGREAALADAAPSQSLIGSAQEPVALKMGRGLVDTFA